MKKKGSNKIVITDSFQAWAHKWGRIGTLIALLYMIAIPFVVLTFYDSLPSIGEVINLSTISILSDIYHRKYYEPEAAMCRQCHEAYQKRTEYPGGRSHFFGCCCGMFDYDDYHSCACRTA